MTKKVPRASQRTHREHLAAKARETLPLNLAEVALIS